MKLRRPRIGITPDVEWAAGGLPPRPFYTVDATNLDALRAAGAVGMLLPHEPAAIRDYVDACDGVWITGGGFQFPHPDLLAPGAAGGDEPHKHNRAVFEQELVAAFLAADKPVFGVCGGFQIMNRVLGGKLIVSLADSWQGSIDHRQPQSYAEGSHTVCAEAGSLLEKLIGSGHAFVNSKHRQGVAEIGRAARVAARSPDGLVEAIEVPGKRFAIGVQWHPEFHVSPADARLIAGFVAAARAEGDS